MVNIIVKKAITYFLFIYILLSVVLFSGCSKRPSQELHDARAAVDAAMAEGAEKFAPDETGIINDMLTNAINEIEYQDKKFFKDYKKAREILLKVKLGADSLKASLPEKKERAHKKALTALKNAESVINEAKNQIKRSPKGKISQEDLDVFVADIEHAEEIFSEAYKALNIEDFKKAIEKSESARKKANETIEQIKKLSTQQQSQKNITLYSRKDNRVF